MTKRKIWTKELCQIQALKYDTRTKFYKGNQCAYNASCKKKWLNDVCSHMKIQGSTFLRYVYIVLFSDNSIYIGLTYNIRKRFIYQPSGHFYDKKSAVYKRMMYLNEMPKIFKTDLIDAQEASKLECEYIKYYKKKGYHVLNNNSGGNLGGDKRKWKSKEICQIEALKYKTRNEFCIKSAGAYNACVKNKWLNVVCSHMTSPQLPSGYWNNKERCLTEALKYKTRKEFGVKSHSAYAASLKNKWLDEICSHMEYICRPKYYWTKELCQIEALKYSSLTEFRIKSTTVYNKCQQNKWLVDLCKHML
jgi:predicted GIY-YIG superfamily endonuclease/isopentenyldiphosphate isomerase